MPMIEISSTVKLDENELHFEFVRASGPGGQNVNKVASAAQLRFDARNSPSLSDEIKERLIKFSGQRATQEGIIIIEAKNFRTQEQNKLEAIRRLVALIERALVVPKVRRKTKPSATASAARVFDKKRRGAIKKIRGYNPDEWE